MTWRPAPDTRLSDLLLALATETDMSVEAVRSAIADTPEFEADIWSFALEWGVMTSEAVPSEALVQAEAVVSARDVVSWAAAEVHDPFAGKSPSDLKAIATLVDLPFSILSKLCQRLIDATTIPLALVRALAPHLNAKPGELFAFLDLQPTLATADYRSTVRPEVSEKMSFAEAVRTTDMPAGQRDKWLSLAE